MKILGKIFIKMQQITQRSEEHTSELQSRGHLVCRLPPRYTLFPYTTLFRSLVASDESMVKVHIHAEQPGEVMTIAQQYGDLVEIDIENMRKQYKEIVKDENSREDIHKNATNYAEIGRAHV